MSRLDGRYADVERSAAGGPQGFWLRGEGIRISVTGVVEHYREWIGVLEGEPERDIWRVDTSRGTCELHHLRRLTAEDDEPDGDWVLFRWED